MASTTNASGAIQDAPTSAIQHGIPTDLSPEQQLEIAQTAIIAYVKNKIEGLSLVLLVSYAVLCALCIVLVIYLRHNRGGARRGDSDAARKMLLPAFEPLLWILGGTSAVYCVYIAVALSLGFLPLTMPSVHIECFYAGRQFVLLLVVVFMLQTSVTIPALARAVAITLVLSTYTLPVARYMETHAGMDRTNINFWLQVITHSLVQFLFVYVLVWPPSRSSKGALRRYCVFALVQYGLEIAVLTAFRHWKVDLGFHLTYASLAVGSLCPLLVWGVLKGDTEHWRGLGQRACALQALFRQRTSVHEHLSCEGLHVLVEMHRKYIIDFAHLELRQRIGVGSSAVVYNGVLRSKTAVAIKVYTPTTVTEEAVAAFSHEAALCGALNHPNVVRFYGMCVSPPTICLVSELCRGSLDVVTHALTRQRHCDHYWRAQTHSRPLAQQHLELHHDRQQFLIQLGFILDAARAVAYIHSFSPAFVHRDIKPANFLVDARGTVKLTDFGESRALPKMRAIAAIRAEPASSIGGRSSRAADAAELVIAGAPQQGDRAAMLTNTSSTSTSSSARGGRQNTQSSPPSSPDSSPYVNYKRDGARAAPGTDTPVTRATSSSSATSQMTVKGTIDYMAPEMISGKAGFASYGEAADVYSLAITMWDVLNPEKEKYPRAKNNHLRIFESVVAGERPELDATLHPALRDLLVRSWHQDHWRRPTAQAIVQTLEHIQEEVASAFAWELQLSFGGKSDGSASIQSTGGESNGGSRGVAYAAFTESAGTRSDASAFAFADSKRSGCGSQTLTVSGDALVSKLSELHAVATVSEGVRLGSMLMDAGCLHHVKHSQAFECRGDALYFFDADRRLVKPDRYVKRLFRRKYAPVIPEHSVLTANLLGSSHQHFAHHRDALDSDSDDENGLFDTTGGDADSVSNRHCATGADERASVISISFDAFDDPLCVSE